MSQLTNAQRLEVIKKLKGPSIVIIDDKNAMWKISSDSELLIDVSFPPELWPVKFKGKECDWKKSFEVPNITKAQVEVFTGDYLAACEVLSSKEGSEEIDEAELKTSEEEEKKIIEMERREKEAEAEALKAAQEEENARKRAENEKKLAMMEQFEQERQQAEQERQQAEQQKPKDTGPKKPETPNPLYSQPEDVLETAPVPKKGEVGLLDILYELVDDDLIQIFGKTGTCKTTIAIQAALEARKAGRSVYYLDPEKNISKRKKAEMLKSGVTYTPYTPDNPNGNFETVKDLEAFHAFIKKIPKVDLLIIDSLGLPCLSVYCAGNQRDQGQTLQKMMLISNTLKSYANRNKSLVIVINQPESDMNKDPNTERRSFGDKVEFYYKELLKTVFVSKSPNKTSVVVKTYRSRDYGQGTKLFTVEITGNGIKVIQ